MTFFLNILILFIVAAPLIFLDVLRSYSKWIDDHHGFISFIVWIIMLVVLYVFILPAFNMEPNPDNMYRN